MSAGKILTDPVMPVEAGGMTPAIIPESASVGMTVTVFLIGKTAALTAEAAMSAANALEKMAIS